MTTLPLSHISVLDLTAHRAGPTAVRQLADWGAQVIKIEPPAEPGGTDAMGGSRHGFDFQNLHRNKKAMTLNLKSKEGHAIFMKLAEEGRRHRRELPLRREASPEGRLRHRGQESIRASSTARSRASARAARTRRAPASTRSPRAWAG